MTPDKRVELDKVIEAIGIATYGGRSFEPTGMYREKLTNILTQYHQDLMSEVVGKINALPGIGLPDSYSESPEIISKDQVKTIIKSK